MSGGESDILKKYFSVKVIPYYWGPSSHRHLWKSDTTWMLSFPRDGTAYAKIRSFVKKHFTLSDLPKSTDVEILSIAPLKF